MLEILFLIWFGKRLAAICRERGRSEGWVAVAVLFWFGGEVIGGLIGFLLGLGAGAYLAAIVIAVVGAGVSWTVITSLPPRLPAPLR